jgi:putative nucleic acid modification protein with dual OB domain
MPTRFVCLANSYKEGGRCVAGIELDNNNIPKIKNGNPKWIRPICDTLHGEIPTDLVAQLDLLDVIELDTTDSPEERNYQSENIYFSENSIKVVDRFNSENLNQLLDNRRLIFDSRGKAMSEEFIDTLSYSLMFIKTDEFQLVSKSFDDHSKKPQARMLFCYHGNEYDFPITDPVFLHRYKVNRNFINQYNEANLCVSVGIPWNNRHYKLVAGIILKKS